MIPFDPEPLQALRRRLPKALDRVFDPEEVRARPETRPGLKRRHVFDFADGVRLIVSAEKGVGLHVTASFVEGTAVDRRLRKAARVAGAEGGCDRLRREGEDAFRRLAGPETALEFLGFLQGKGIPHWRADRDGCD